MIEKTKTDGAPHDDLAKRKDDAATSETRARSNEAKTGDEQQDEEELEEGLEESFPGSDAPASTMRHEK